MAVPVIVVAVVLLVTTTDRRPQQRLSSATTVIGVDDAPESEYCDKPGYKEQCPNFPPSRRPGPDVRPLTKDEAVARARRAGGGEGLPPVGENAPVMAERMSYEEYLKRSGQGADPLINPKRPVWVVGVNAKTQGRGLRGDCVPPVDEYTVVYDVPTGFQIARGLGVNVLAPPPSSTTSSTSPATCDDASGNQRQTTPAKGPLVRQ